MEMRSNVEIKQESVVSVAMSEGRSHSNPAPMMKDHIQNRLG